MAEEILNCDPSEPITKVDWEEIVGDKTIDDGGYFGDLLQVTRVHLEDAKNKGELREEDSGVAYSTAIMESMKNAIAYGTTVDKSNLELCYLRAQIDKLECDCTNETALNNAKIELIAEQTETEDKQNMVDGVLDNQIAKIQADVIIAQEDVKIRKAEADKSYVEMLANIDKVYGFSYTLDQDGNIIREDLIDTQDGKMDYENIMTEKQSELVAQQVLTEENNTTLVKEKTETEDKQNMTDGMIDKQIEKIAADILLSQEEINIRKAESDKSYVEMLASIDKEYGFSYVLDQDGNIIRDQLTDTQDGTMDYKNLMTQAQAELVAQQKLTEVENTALIIEKVESEDKQNTTDGMIDKQIQKIDSDILLSQEEINIKKAESDKAYVEMLALVDKEYGFSYTLDQDGNIIRDQLTDTQDGTMDYKNLMTEKQSELIAQQVLTEVENTTLIKEKTETEDKQNMVDGMIDKQIEKIAADINIAEEELQIRKQEADKVYVEMLANVKKIYGYDYTLDPTTGEIERDSLTPNNSGKYDYENILTEKQGLLVSQQTLTEENNTELVLEKKETENKHNEPDGLIDKQIDKIDADILLSQEEIDLKKQQADKAYAEMLATIDKEYGMYYELDANGDIKRSSITSDGGGKIDAELEILNAEKELKIDALTTEQSKRDEMILARKRELLSLRLRIYEALYGKKVISNMPGIIDDSNASTIDSLYTEVHTGEKKKKNRINK